MNLKCRMILEDFRKQRADFVELGTVVQGLLQEITQSLNLPVLAIEHRVKQEDSLAGKLERKGDHYNTIEDITDLLGCRIICFLSDEIDRIGKKVEETFVIDWENSSDKRALIDEESFGYLSLHYICFLPDDGRWPKELCGKKFEIQIRTILQHAWSVINHDIGYKSEFGVPRDIRRQFARLAGMLELADDEFVRTRDRMQDYTDTVRKQIQTSDAKNVVINMISLREYVFHNQSLQNLMQEIAHICQAEIQETDPESYIPQLAFLGIVTLGDLDDMLSRNRDLALRLAEKSLAFGDFDLLSTSAVLRFLCRAELLNQNASLERTTEFLMLSLKNRERAERQARHLLAQKEEL